MIRSFWGIECPKQWLDVNERSGRILIESAGQKINESRAIYLELIGARAEPVEAHTSTTQGSSLYV